MRETSAALGGFLLGLCLSAVMARAPAEPVVQGPNPGAATSSSSASPRAAVQAPASPPKAFAPATAAAQPFAPDPRRDFAAYRRQYRAKRLRAQAQFELDRRAEERPLAGLSFDDPRYPADLRPGAFEEALEGLEPRLDEGIGGYDATVGAIDCSAVPCLVGIDIQVPEEERDALRTHRDDLDDEFMEVVDGLCGQRGFGTTTRDDPGGAWRHWVYCAPFSSHEHPYLTKQVSETAFARVGVPR